jgi:hypothetical protein
MSTRAYLLQTPPRFERCFHLRIRDVETVPTDDGFGTRTVPTGETEHTVEVVIDLEQIVRVLGHKAVKNRTGKARDGFVTVKRVGKGKKLS